MEERVSHVLFYSHITPNSTTGLTPAELLQNRRLRSRLDLVKPNIEDHVVEQEVKQHYYANRHSKSRGFQVGDPVYVRNFGAGSKWIPWFISAVGGIMFDVSLSDGKTIHHHIDHIRSRVEEVQTNVNLPPEVLPFEPPTPSSVHPSIESSVEPTESTNHPIVERPYPPIVKRANRQMS